MGAGSLMGGGFEEDGGYREGKGKGGVERQTILTDRILTPPKRNTPQPRERGHREQVSHRLQGLRAAVPLLQVQAIVPYGSSERAIPGYSIHQHPNVDGGPRR